jgi:hypothetical protein
MEPQVQEATSYRYVMKGGLIMKAKLCFMVKLPWQITVYELLKELAVTHIRVAKKGLWFFECKDVKKVDAILGKHISIPGYMEHFEKVKVKLPSWKGKDFIEVREFPTYYILVEHRKVEGGIIKKITHEISKETVKKIWKGVISRQPLKKPIKTRTVARNICRVFGIDRFDRDTGTFSFEKFFGTRKDYYNFFYLPVKVLCGEKKVKHHKSGKVERLI